MSFITKIEPEQSYHQLENRASLDNHEFNPSRTSRPRHGLWSYRTAFFVFSFLYFTSTFLLLLRQNISPSPDSVLPPVSRDDEVLFSPDADFDTFREGNDSAWAGLIPAGRGFISVPTAVDQPDGSTEMEDKHYCISMFHQLHCLANLKRAFSSPHPSSSSSSENKKATADKHKHLAHCFDYLRQAVMCAGDMTLEPARTYVTPEETFEAVNGWGVRHQCRSFERVFEIAQERRVRGGER